MRRWRAPDPSKRLKPQSRSRRWRRPVGPNSGGLSRAPTSERRDAAGEDRPERRLAAELGQQVGVGGEVVVEDGPGLADVG